MDADQVLSNVYGYDLHTILEPLQRNFRSRREPREIDDDLEVTLLISGFQQGLGVPISEVVTKRLAYVDTLRMWYRSRSISIVSTSR
jgi:hypothetical protein